MHILLLAPYAFLPAQSGGQNLIARFCAELSAQVRLTVCSSEGNLPSTELGYTLLPWLGTGPQRYCNVAAMRRLEKYIASEKVTWIIVEHPYLGWMGRALSRSTGARWMVHTHNIEFERWKQLGKWWWPLLKNYEKWVLRNAHFISYLTEQDKQGMKQLTGREEQSFVALPYGIHRMLPPAIDEREMAKKQLLQSLSLNEKTMVLGFNGAMDYLPNEEAMRVLLTEWIPALSQNNDLNFVLIVCGRGMPEDLQKRIKDEAHAHYLGFVPSIEAINLATDVFLNPVYSGGGVKTKLIDALAAGAKAISYEEGAYGIDQSVAGKALQIIQRKRHDDIKELVKQQMLETGVDTGFYQHFSWKNIVQNLLRKLSE